jgi:prolipoprotein diacylglyceryltransferase
MIGITILFFIAIILAWLMIVAFLILCLSKDEDSKFFALIVLIVSGVLLGGDISELLKRADKVDNINIKNKDK